MSISLTATQNVTVLSLTATQSGVSVTVNPVIDATGGGSGTVTSVAATVPTGFTVSGSPITLSGTLAIAYDTGYEGFTTAEASAITANTAKVSLDSNSVTEAKLAPQYKGSSVISALNVDWSASQTYTKPLTGNTVLTFSNLYIGIKSLVITGNYTLGFPTGFTLTIDSNAYDGTKVCLISVECWDTSTPVGLVHITYSV